MLYACHATGIEIKISKERDEELKKDFTVATVKMYPNASTIKVERMSSLEDLFKEIMNRIPDLYNYRNIQY